MACYGSFIYAIQRTITVLKKKLICRQVSLSILSDIAISSSDAGLQEVLETTRIQLERELSLDDIHRIRDIPAYNLLYK